MADVPASLEVRLHDRIVGHLVRLPDRRYLIAFDEQYARDSTRPILSLGFLTVDGRLHRQAPTRPDALHPFFTNMLPEGRLRAYIADRAGVSSSDDFAMLWVTGRDLPGAVTVVDPDGRPVPPPALRASSAAPDGKPLFRFSLAGVQLKFSAIECARGGLTIPVNAEDTQWIVKLPSLTYRGVPENEFAMMTLAARCGFEVPEIELVAVDAIDGLPTEIERLDRKALAIRRFDRGAGAERIHIEDLCQAFRVQPANKYRARSFVDNARLITMVLGADQLAEFMRRLIFGIAIANTDMHLKNWTLIYRDPIRPALSPMYDYVSIKPYTKTNETGLAIGNAREFNAVTADQLVFLATRAGASPKLVVTAANAMVDRFIDEWKRFRNDVSPNIRAVIDAQVTDVPLLRDRHRSRSLRV
jgi:serine/threonine-protein kinase HipA